MLAATKSKRRLDGHFHQSHGCAKRNFWRIQKSKESSQGGATHVGAFAIAWSGTASILWEMRHEDGVKLRFGIA